MFNVHINDGQTPIPEGDICYIIGKDGIYLKKKLGIVESCTKVDKISVLNDVEVYGRLHLPKIPGKTFSRVFGFFREAYLKYKGESAVILYYHDDSKKYKIEVPTQEVSGASVSYEVDTEVKRTDGYRVIGTIHSHANFGAFHSGVDIADEKNFDGLHITIGHVAQSDGHFTLASSIAINGSRFVIDPQMYIDGITPRVEYKSVIIDGKETLCPVTTGNDKEYIWSQEITDEDLEFNPKWMDKVSERKYTTYRSGEYTGGYDWWNQHQQPNPNRQNRWWEKYYSSPQYESWDDYTGSVLSRDEKKDQPVSEGHRSWKDFIKNKFTRDDHDHYNKIAGVSGNVKPAQKPLGMSKKEWKWFKKNHNKIEAKMSEREKELEKNPQLNLFTLDPRKRNVQVHIPCAKCIHRDLLDEVKKINEQPIGFIQPTSIWPENDKDAKEKILAKMERDRDEARMTIKANFPQLSDKEIEQVLDGMK